MILKPKYQVFISSTWDDLKDIRNAVTWCILKLEHIPAGMESFPAATDRGWETISTVIDDSDYYVLIIAGRYGSIDPSTGMSWTDREYQYALKKGVPILAFIRSDDSITSNKTEKRAAGKKRRDEFVNRVRKAHLTASDWSDENDLCQKITATLSQTFRNDEYGARARPGWYRGDVIPSRNVIEDFARLSSENAKLAAQLDDLKKKERAEIRLFLPSGNMEAFTSAGARYSYIPERSVLPGIQTGVSDQAYIDYLDSRTRTAWIDLSVENVGRVSAREIIVEVRIRGVENVVTEDNHPNMGLVALRKFKTNPRTDPNQHCYIDNIQLVSNESIVRIRIKSVVPGGTEQLPAFGMVFPPFDGKKSAMANIRYRILDSSGLLGESSSPIPVSIELIQTIELDRQHADRLSERHQLPVPR